MKITINVTKEIIDQCRHFDKDKFKMNLSEWVRHWHLNCAFSVAVREIFPNAWTEAKQIIPFKDEEYKTLRMKGFKQRDAELLMTKIPLPKEAKEWIEEFDQLCSVSRMFMKPISVTIDLPEKCIHKIGIEEVYKILSTSKTLELALV